MNEFNSSIQEEITVYYKIDGQAKPFKYPVGTNAGRLISDRNGTGDLKRKAAGGYIAVSHNDLLLDRAEYATFKASNSAC